MIRCVIPISGGKDSQACLKLALEYFRPEECLGLFCDTQWEFPETYAHVAWMAEHYGVYIHRITAGSVLSECEKAGRFPGGGSRHCTDNLKIKPSKLFYAALARLQGTGFEVWYGMRFEESQDRKKRYAGKLPGETYAPHEVLPKKYPKYLAVLGVSFRLAVVDWSEKEIFEFLDGKENPLYELYDRVGCAPCLAAGDVYKENVFQSGPFGAEQWHKVKIVSWKINKPVYDPRRRRGIEEAKLMQTEGTPCALMCGG